MVFFSSTVSHVAMIGKNGEIRKAAEQSPSFFFVDVFALNQVAVENHSENMHQVLVGQSVTRIYETLSSRATCNSMVLCCSAGPSGEPGWVGAGAVSISRIW